MVAWPVNPGASPLRRKKEAADFQTLFRDSCSGCHGAEGRGGPGRILNDGLYLAFIPKENLRNVIEHGRAGTAMPAWARADGGPLTPEQISLLVDGMERNWAKAVNLHGATLPAYEAGAAAGDATRGKKLFLTGLFCMPCEGRARRPVNGSGLPRAHDETEFADIDCGGAAGSGHARLPDVESWTTIE